ncbi:rod shape-determining protein MreD [Rugosibacter aromaticivorans]|uniref:Rod shape-determining protein MreD n=1 Tax=Rugosibacter aromaticivorans TaxID=1565605 RepID=A0A0C5J5I9_9PROT|nr:rod shape-determining protein MreD [Rugosibacter aromaticivorans]AJP47265.1 rod shape-determining protein MreD [Rugosibacter aromaticivorans]TBR16555.1 MAG: rod shape-determining protein MreD [Rugosibacter sp.]
MQPTHSMRRILLPAKNWFIVSTLCAALLLNMIPFGYFPGIPDWVALVLTFWCLHQPLKVGMGAGFILGLFMDVVDASVMGQHALAYVFLAFAAAGLSRRVLWFPLAQQALHVLLLLLGEQLIMLFARMLGGANFPGFGWFFSSVIAALFWYPLTYLLLAPQFQPQEKDFDRPI